MRKVSIISFMCVVPMFWMVATSAQAEISFTNVTTTNLNPARPDTFVAESWGVSIGDLEGDHWPDVYVTNHRARPSYYRNNGDGTLIDNTLQVDLSNIFTSTKNEDRHGASFSDFDGDGDHDLWSMQAGRGESFKTHQPLFIVGPDGRMTDEGYDRALTHFWGHSAFAFDVDADGISDVVQGQSGAGDFHYYRQDPAGNFSPLSKFPGCGATWVNIADFTGDQEPDILCQQEGAFPSGARSGFGSWQTNIKDIFPSVSNVVDTAAADFDNDLDMDLIVLRGATLPNQVTQTASDKFEASIDVGNANKEFRFNFEGGGVIEVKVYTNRGYEVLLGADGVKQTQNGAITTFTLDPNDTATHGISDDRDVGMNLYFGYDQATDTWTGIQHTYAGWWYIYMEFKADSTINNVEAVTGSNGLTERDLPIRPRLLSHDNGQYENATFASGMGVDLECGSVAVADFDNDMDNDIYAVCSRGVENIANRLFENQGDGTFIEVTSHGGEGAIGGGLQSRVGQGESVGTGDFDNDGFMDLFVVNGMNSQPVRIGGGPHELILNNTDNGNHWIEIELRGTDSSDANAVGARVVASAGGVQQLRYQDGGFHRWSQNHDRIHFGLGSNDTVDIDVRWPDGQVETYTDVAADAQYVATQGIGIVAAIVDPPKGYPAPEEGDECGTAPYWSDRDQGVFIYKNCINDVWQVRASAGGQQKVLSFSGKIISDQAITGITGYSLEGGEVIDNSANTAELNFVLTAYGAGEDGFDFELASGATACVALNTPTNVPLLFGSQTLPVDSPFEITTLEVCQQATEPEFTMASATVNEAAGTVDLEVAISSAPTSDASVKVATIAGSATGGSDFYGGVATLDFPAGETAPQVFTVTLINDGNVESDETFQARLFQSNGATVAEEFTDITIEDDDVNAPTPVILAVTATTVNENDGTVDIEITISQAPVDDVTVKLATLTDTAVGGSDFYGKALIVNFPAGQATPQIVPVTLVNDNVVEVDENFRIRLYQASSNAVVAQPFTDITIEDDDASMPVLPVFSIVTTSVNEAAGEAIIEVSVDIAPENDASVKISTVVSSESNAATKGPAGDFYGSSATLRFPQGQSGTQTFKFDLIDDSTSELDEVIDLRLYSAIGGTIPTSFTPVLILDDD